MKWYYGVPRGGLDRVIGNEKAAGEVIHFSAEERALHPTNNYQSPNLIGALEKKTVPVTKP